MIEKITYKGYTIKTHHDEYAESPREWSNLGTIATTRFAQEIDYLKNLSGRLLAEAITNTVEAVKKSGGIVLPIYCYSHGRDTLRTRPWSDGELPEGHARFDSGLAGFIFAEPSEIRASFMVKRITADIREKAEKCLKGEVETYDQYINGEVYGFELEDENGDSIDSCCGYFGYDYMISEVKSEIDSIIKREMEAPATRELVMALLD